MTAITLTCYVMIVRHEFGIQEASPVFSRAAVFFAGWFAGGAECVTAVFGTPVGAMFVTSTVVFRPRYGYGLSYRAVALLT